MEITARGQTPGQRDEDHGSDRFGAGASGEPPEGQPQNRQRRDLEDDAIPAVEHAAPGCKFDYHFICDEALDEKLNLSPSTQIQIYRIAQEALSNICRHANARLVTMHARTVNGSAFELVIEDDGRGFDRTEAKKRAARGLTNIRARASMIDAEVEWAKRNGGGTVFRLTKHESDSRLSAD